MLKVPQGDSKREGEGLNVAADAALRSLEVMINFYQEKLTESKARSATDHLRVISREVDKDGVHGLQNVQPTEPMYVFSLCSEKCYLGSPFCLFQQDSRYKGGCKLCTVGVRRWDGAHDD